MKNEWREGRWWNVIGHLMEGINLIIKWKGGEG